MKYQVSNQTNKTSAKGTNYVQVTLQDEAGNIFDKINLFKGEATGKTEIEGNLIKNGEYWNFEANVVHPANFPTSGRGGAMAKVMEAKAENIEHAQDRKNEAIVNAGSITNATNLVTAMINAGIIPSVATESQVQDAVIKYAKWYKTIYNNPSNTDNAPF